MASELTLLATCPLGGTVLQEMEAEWGPAARLPQLLRFREAHSYVLNAHSFPPS